MKSGNRQEVEVIFHQALQHDPAQRDTFVREACHGDSELQREVSSLLACAWRIHKITQQSAAGTARDSCAPQ